MLLDELLVSDLAGLYPSHFHRSVLSAKRSNVEKLRKILGGRELIQKFISAAHYLQDKISQ